MKNKTPKPRVMWANYYPLAGWSHPCIHPTLSQAKATAAGCAKPVRVAVIPLDDVEGMVIKAAGAYWAREKTGATIVTRGDAMRMALSAIGIPCLKRKARK